MLQQSFAELEYWYRRVWKKSLGETEISQKSYGQIHHDLIKSLTKSHHIECEVLRCLQVDIMCQIKRSLQDNVLAESMNVMRFL